LRSLMTYCHSRESAKHEFWKLAAGAVSHGS
jgi:hypothetical protein